MAHGFSIYRCSTVFFSYEYVHSDNNALSMKAANWFRPRKINANSSAKIAGENAVSSTASYPMHGPERL